MKYEELYTDYEKMLREGMLRGFLKNNFSTLYEYLYKRVGIEAANAWMLQNKKEKKLYCAKLIIEYIYDNESLCQSAQKFINKVEGRK